MLKNRQPLKLSLILHGIALVVVALATFMGGCKEKAMPDHVFEMVDVSLPDVMPRAPQVNNAAPPIANLSVPRIKPLAPPPAPAPQRVTKPTKPVVKPPPPVKQIAYDPNKYASKPVKQPKKPAKSTTKVNAPQFNAEKFSQQLSESIDSIELKPAASGARTSQEQKILKAYGETLSPKIKQAWDKPSAAGRLKIALYVSADGRLRATIVRSSGNALLDASVLKAVERVGKVAPPPFGEAVSFNLQFELLQS